MRVQDRAKNLRPKRNIRTAMNHEIMYAAAPHPHARSANRAETFRLTFLFSFAQDVRPRAGAQKKPQHMLRRVPYQNSKSEKTPKLP